MMKKTASVLIVYNSKVLLQLRDNVPTIQDPNKWNFIGGHVEAGESFDDAIIREIHEETNLRPTNIKYIGILRRTNTNSAGYVCYLNEKQVRNLKLGNEGQALGFFTLDEACSLDLSPMARFYFEKYLTQIEKIVNGEELVATELGLEN